MANIANSSFDCVAKTMLGTTSLIYLNNIRSYRPGDPLMSDIIEQNHFLEEIQR